MAKVKMLIGIPGSGKTSYAKAKLKNENTVYLSSDDIRVDMFGFEDQTHNQEVFERMQKETLASLKAGFDVIYDATNLNRKRRMHFINNVCKNYEVEGYFVITDIGTILIRNMTRTERTIPAAKLKEMICNVDIPFKYEGFSSIKIICNFINDPVSQFLEDSESFIQNNPHHGETLKEHARMVENKVPKNNIILKTAAKWHDIGKIIARQFNEEKGYDTYYNHEKVSAYLYLCNEVYESKKNSIKKMTKNYMAPLVAELIAHHMDFYKANLEKTREYLGDKLYDMLLELHRADEYRDGKDD